MIHPQYRVRTINLPSKIKLESYLNKYPLFSSKYLNYKDWLKILEFKKIAKYDTCFIDKVIEIKKGMNNKRTNFVPVPHLFFIKRWGTGGGIIYKGFTN